MKNIITRSITGLFYVLSAIAAVFINPAIAQGYFLAIALIGLWEFYHNIKAYDIHPNIVLGFIASFLTYIIISELVYKLIDCNDCAAAMQNIIKAVLIFLYLAIFIVELYRKKDRPFTNIAYTFLGIIYIIIPLALTNQIIGYGGIYVPWLLMCVFIFAWCNDTFAYLSGMAFGKHKLFERISPKKTWEGSLGGFISVIIAALIIYKCLKSNENYQFLKIYDYTAIAVITSIIGTFGDLVESIFKRQLGIKDSGNILPGHGGILDRFDILLMVLPAVFAYLIIRFQDYTYWIQ